MLPLETLENRNIYERELFFHFKKALLRELKYSMTNICI